MPYGRFFALAGFKLTFDFLQGRIGFACAQLKVSRLAQAKRCEELWDKCAVVVGDAKRFIKVVNAPAKSVVLDRLTHRLQPHHSIR